MHQFGTSAGELGYSVAVDSTGNVYVVGRTTGIFSGQTAPGNGDAFVWKYNSVGSLVWGQQFGTSGDDGAWAVATDASGNVLVTGDTSGAFVGSNAGENDGFVRKLDSSGGVVWTQQFGTNKDDHVRAVAVDAGGNVFVAGYTLGALSGSNAGNNDAFVRKYSSGGTAAWTRQFGTASDDQASSAAVDASGNVYVAGKTIAPGTYNSFLQKYDASGNPLWSQPFADAYTFSAAVDPNGYVLVAGLTDYSLSSPNAGISDAFVRKYDNSGGVVWTRQFGTSANDYAYGVATDASGNVFVAGFTDGSLAGANLGSDDALVRKFDSSGNVVWTQQFGTSARDSISAVSVDANGKVYVAGSTSGTFSGQTSAGDWDAWVAQLSP